jgi:hypothetical protein
LLGVEEISWKIFTKQLTTKFCARKLSILGIVVVKNCNYSMKHRRSGGLKHTTCSGVEMSWELHNKSMEARS